MATTTGPSGATSGTPATGGTPSPTPVNPTPPAPPVTPPPPVPTPPPLSAEDVSAKAAINKVLTDLGLPLSLGDWAWTQHLNGMPDAQIWLDLRQRPEYKARYPAMEELARQGRAITEAEYSAYEKTVADLSRQYGVPLDMYATSEGVAKMLTNGVSVKEANDRFQIASSAAFTAPSEVRDALGSLYNVSHPDLIAYWLDPDKAMPLLQRQYDAAQIAGAATQQELGIDVSVAEDLASRGITFDQARTGFGQASSVGSLDFVAGEGTTQAERIAAAFGDAEAQAKVTRVQRSRAAAFQGGGGPQSAATGISGLGVDTA